METSLNSSPIFTFLGYDLPFFPSLPSSFLFWNRIIPIHFSRLRFSVNNPWRSNDRSFRQHPRSRRGELERTHYIPSDFVVRIHLRKKHAGACWPRAKIARGEAVCRFEMDFAAKNDRLSANAGKTRASGDAQWNRTRFQRSHFHRAVNIHYLYPLFESGFGLMPL